jgi:NAD+ synthase (glutamine-hydrolysing)
MRVALAQINSRMGDFAANRRKILEFTARAKERRCDLVVFPEAALFGYHPMDLLAGPKLVDEQLKELNQISKSMPSGIIAVVGLFTKNPSAKGKRNFNSAAVLARGKKPQFFHKELLPTYDVFDDARHIQPGDLKKNVVRINGKKVFITICEDIWAWPIKGQKPETLYDENPIKKIRPGAVDLVINLSASPYFDKKMLRRLTVTRATAKYLRAPIVYVNRVGAQDELIFDGGSFALDKSGKVLAQCVQFHEDLNVVDFKTLEGGRRELSDDSIENLRQALVLGIRDFVEKIGISKVHTGLSGGVDSAVVACLAVDALGPGRVNCYAMPGPHSSDLSFDLAQKLSENIGVHFHTVPILSAYDEVVGSLDKALGKIDFGLTHENIQARLRGLYLMAIANRDNSLLLNTTNKSEMAAGYGTLYGDMCGGLSPIGDLLKSEVYALAKHYNAQYEVIPEKIITREPSAELRPNQRDQDTLPPYDELDKSVVRLVEQKLPPRTESDQFLVKALAKSEFKRWQSPPILKVREYSFGRGRRMPV